MPRPRPEPPRLKVYRPPKLPWAIERTAPNVVTARFDDVREGWEQWVLLRTDAHHDHPKCDQKLEEKHLKEAIACNAMILDNGDLFCAMQGKYDKRSNKECIRPEHQTGDYLDKLVTTAYDFYRPYQSHFAVLGRGNHETAIRKNHETDLTDRLGQLMTATGSPVLTSGYGGWLRFSLKVQKTKGMTYNLYHYHGSGGGGPVTRGVIQTNRVAVYTPDAHVVFTGHTHDSWTVPIPRVRVSTHGTVFHDEQLHVRAGGYKDAWGDGSHGWEVETNKGPKPLCAAWLRLYYENNDVKYESRRAM